MLRMIFPSPSFSSISTSEGCPPGCGGEEISDPLVEDWEQELQ
uniref:Uncharacterized protein n=1 Tax=Ciona savignyi TaxID=51511 RepID=H2ZB78_CIOSA